MTSPFIARGRAAGQGQRRIVRHLGLNRGQPAMFNGADTAAEHQNAGEIRPEEVQEANMSGGRVLTTPEAANAAKQMGVILNSGLASEIQKLDSQGKTLSDPNVWAGPHADTFRNQWPQINSTLVRLQGQLTQLQTAVKNVNADIAQAGGGSQ
jgi:uncharacterized protein YukE